MTVYTELRSILEEIVLFENWIDTLDAANGLRHYSIFLPSRVIPYSIEVRRNADNAVIAILNVNYDDIIMTLKFCESMEQEIMKVSRMEGSEQYLDELYLIKRIFGVPKYLSNPKGVLGHNGEILTIYMDYFRRHSDIYFQARIEDSTDQIYLKVDQDLLLRYLNDVIILKNVLSNPCEPAFYYQNNVGDIIRAREVSIELLTNYRVMYADKKISEVPAELVSSSLQETIAFYENLRREDPYGQEIWAKDYDPVSIFLND